ncbi:MAG TPA: hypothetical protein VF681_06395 [Abditibacteriaceae bacterium]|jgi:hypothetical protein
MKKFLLGAALFGAALSLAPSSHAAPADSNGERIGFSGVKPNLEKVEIASPHVYDYTFASAPTDWRVQSGVWEMTNRWSCSPGWSWFGGRSEETAAVWNKRKFSGDMSVQYYFAFKMGLSGAEKWWEYGADAALTISGDGKNLASGYSLILGADNNTHTILRKGSEVVAESREPWALLPVWTDGVPPDHDETMHRRWWYVRMDKIGSKVSCYLDNKLLFSYDDPKPLDAGHIALWTYNNGIMLSRVQVYYENEVQRSFVNESRLAKATAKGHTSPLPSKPQGQRQAQLER